ncbi:MAG: class I SAM-dependent methyltransferase [Gammaproteobacteria bacterium]
MTTEPLKQHWESIWARQPPDRMSWYQPHAATSLRLIQKYAPPPAEVIDVGGGASVLVDELIEAGYPQPMVLDIAGDALEISRARLGTHASSAQWIENDVTDAVFSVSAFDVWHDRAVFHFLTEADARQHYVARLRAALRSGGIAVLATFAANGPEHCSGLPTCRYDAAGLTSELGADFALLEACEEDHYTPGGKLQRFQYAVFRLD